MTAPRFCPECGTARVEVARFCGTCGADLAPSAAPVTVSPGPVAPPPAVAPAVPPRRRARVWAAAASVALVAIAAVVVGVVALQVPAGGPGLPSVPPDSGAIALTSPDVSAEPTAIATGTPSPRPTPRPTSKPTRAPEPVSVPLWVERVRDNPIVPGVGLAGVSIGDPEQAVLEWLGDASLVPEPNRNEAGEIAFYFFELESNGMRLSVSTTPDTRTGWRILLWDPNFNDKGLLPRVERVTIGSGGDAMVRAFGAQQPTDSGFSCPESAGNGTLRTYSYTGISFWVCSANDSVFLIGVP